MTKSKNNIWKRISKSFVNSLGRWTLGEIIFVSISITIIFGISMVTFDYAGEHTPIWVSVTSVIAAVFGVIGVISAAKNDIWNYFWGLIHIILYGIIAFQAGLYGDFMLNWFFFIPTSIYGIFAWKRRDVESIGQTTSRSLGGKVRIYLVVFLIVVTIPYFLFLRSIGDSVPILDSFSTTISIIGMLLMIYSFSEQWICWFFVNVVSVTMWTVLAIQGDTTAIPMVMMWSVYTINSLYGLLKWEKRLFWNSDFVISKNLRESRIELAEIIISMIEKGDVNVVNHLAIELNVDNEMLSENYFSLISKLASKEKRNYLGNIFIEKIEDGKTIFISSINKLGNDYYIKINYLTFNNKNLVKEYLSREIKLDNYSESFVLEIAKLFSSDVDYKYGKSSLHKNIMIVENFVSYISKKVKYVKNYNRKKENIRSKKINNYIETDNFMKYKFSENSENKVLKTRNFYLSDDTKLKFNANRQIFKILSQKNTSIFLSKCNETSVYTIEIFYTNNKFIEKYIEINFKYYR